VAEWGVVEFRPTVLQRPDHQRDLQMDEVACRRSPRTFEPLGRRLAECGLQDRVHMVSRSAAILAAILVAGCGRSRPLRSGLGDDGSASSGGGTDAGTDMARDARLADSAGGVAVTDATPSMGGGSGNGGANGHGGTGNFSGTPGTGGGPASGGATAHGGAGSTAVTSGAGGGSGDGGTTSHGGTASLGGTSGDGTSTGVGFAITSFTASPPIVTLGHSTTLTWTVAGGPPDSALSIGDQAVVYTRSAT
jgi:hypothetical protein